MEIFRKFFFISTFIAFVESQANVSTWPSGTNVPNVCLCAPTGQCNLAGGGAPNDGSGMLEARIQAPNAPQSSGITTGTTSFLTQPIHTGVNVVAMNQETCATNLDRCCPTMGYTCGVRYPPVANAPSPSQSFQAQYGAYPYQGVLLSQLNEYIGSAVLIDHLHALTVAHKVVNSQSQLKLRLGEWDASNIVEPYTPVEFNVTWFAHPNFTSANLKNNIAVLKLSTPVQLGVFPSVGNICLPNTTLSNLRCWVSGWGKDQFGTNGTFANIIKEVDVPLVSASTCQEMLRATRLGPNFQFDSNCFVCAGGEAGKDACTGDGGAPLSCFVGDRLYLAGLVAWGIGCGSANSPGVYTNIQTYVPWIQQTIANWASLPIGNRLTTTPAPGATTTPVLGGTTLAATTLASTTVSTTLPPTTTSTTRAPTTTTSTTPTSSTTTLAPTTTTTTRAPTTTATTPAPTTTTTLAPTVATTTSTTLPPTTTSTTRATTTPTTTLSTTTTQTTLAPTTTSTTRATTISSTTASTTTLAPSTTRTLAPFSTTVRTTTRTTTTTTTTTEAPTTEEEETSPPEYYYYEEETEAPEEEPVEAPGPKPQNPGQRTTSKVTKPSATISPRFTARQTSTTNMRVAGVRNNLATATTTKKPQGATTRKPQGVTTTKKPQGVTTTKKPQGTTTRKPQGATTSKKPQVTTPSKATTKVTTPRNS